MLTYFDSNHGKIKMIIIIPFIDDSSEDDTMLETVPGTDVNLCKSGWRRS